MTSDNATWIDIDPSATHEIVLLGEIVNVAQFDPEDDQTHIANYVPNMGRVHTVVRLRGGAVLASSLSWREWRNRFRKAGHGVI